MALPPGDHTTLVAQALQAVTRVLEPLAQMGDRATLNQVRNGMQRIIDHRTLAHGVVLEEKPKRSPESFEQVATNEAIAIVDRIADASPVQCIALDRLAADPVNRCRYCLARAPEVEALWTDTAWHGTDGSCLYVAAVENRARRDALVPR